ncbi:MAG: molybdate ABC transporter substrate-binding protein [Magnetococcales bacterium]|nr:molybdate ABC transporter substrate-binding protein [Magnetococcales bacterium]
MKHLVLLSWLWMASSAAAGEVQVAVAANFIAPAKVMVEDFARATGHRVRLAVGSTGKFYAQIRNGAPFEALLAADATTPARLEEEGLAVAGSRFVYATGRLVVWSSRPGVAVEALLRSKDPGRLAIADPKLAPYGQAAIETLTSLELLEELRPRLVQGENIAQAYQFVASGNAGLGLLALAQVMRAGAITEGSAWLVPATLHQPIRQEAVLLARGRDNPAALAWLEFLRTPGARRTIAAFGYEE